MRHRKVAARFEVLRDDEEEELRFDMEDPPPLLEKKIGSDIPQ